MERKCAKIISFLKDECTAMRIKWDTVKMTVVFNVKTAVACPCDDEKCVVKICIQKFGDCGDGHKSCPHCLLMRGKGNYFRYDSDMKRNIDSGRWNSKRGITDTGPYARDRFGKLLV